MRIPYAYLKQQTWLYRRTYPKDLQPILGSSLKQSLKTGDAKLARQRAAEVNAKFEEIVSKTRNGQEVSRPDPIRIARPVFTPTVIIGTEPLGQLATQYLNLRSDELRHGGYKSVRFSMKMLVSLYGDRPVGQLTREDGRRFLSLLAQLSPHAAKSYRTRTLGLEQLVRRSKGPRITARTQKRTFSQVNHFLQWLVHTGQLDENPFRNLVVDEKLRPNSYAVLSDEEVQQLLEVDDPLIGRVFQFCLLSGLRSGEASGLLRDDLIHKGNLGWFIRVRPNRVRLLKTDAAERVVPLHAHLEQQLPALGSDRLFPELSVSRVTKRFADLRKSLALERPGLVFHSTRKWFITQCERTGVPEHFTASIVGHQSARSENRLTYGIYSAGISDEQKRSIVDGIRLPDHG